MTNIYFFSKATSPPSPYQAKATWDGRYPKFTNNINNHGVTGGNLTHLHDPANANCGDAPTVTRFASTSGGYASRTHNHPISGVSCSEENNDPLYYQLSLIYMDLAQWEIIERRIPKDAVVLSDATLAAWSEVARLSAADNKVIKLGTPTVTGGRENSIHAVTGTLDELVTVGAARVYGWNYYSCPWLYHSHTFNIPTAAKTIKPARVQTRLYYAAATTIKAQAGMIAFVDGEPSANWVAVDWNDYFLEGANSNPALTGSNTHDHPSVSGESSSFDDLVGSYEDPSVVAKPYHKHLVTLDLLSADHQPQYVNLFPVKLLVTLRPSERSFGGVF